MCPLWDTFTDPTSQVPQDDSEQGHPIEAEEEHPNLAHIYTTTETRGPTLSSDDLDDQIIRVLLLGPRRQPKPEGSWNKESSHLS